MDFQKKEIKNYFPQENMEDSEKMIDKLIEELNRKNINYIL